MPALAEAPTARFAAIDHLPYRALPGRPGRVALRLAALFAEPGQAPARDLERVLKALRFSNVEARLAVDVAQAVGRVEALETLERDRVVLRQWVAAAGRLVAPAAVRVLAARVRADASSDASDIARRFRRLHRAVLAVAWRDPIAVGDLAVDGDDLRAAGIADGRAIGETLQRLLRLVLEDPGRNRRDLQIGRAHV